MAPNSVRTPAIQDNAVTTDKINDDAVTQPKIGSGAVGIGELHADASDRLVATGGTQGQHYVKSRLELMEMLIGKIIMRPLLGLSKVIMIEYLLLS